MIVAGQTDFSSFLRALNVMSKKEFKYVTAPLLTDMAAFGRAAGMKILPRMMTMRTKSFGRSVMRFQKARLRSVNNQYSMVGAIRKKRFTAWEEQQFGGDKRTRSATKQSRRKNYRKSVMRKYRLGKTFKTPEDYYDDSDLYFSAGPKQREAVMLAVARKQHDVGSMMIGTGDGFLKRGVYVMDAKGKVVRVSNLDEPAKTKREPWLSDIADTVRRKYPFAKQFKKYYLRQLKFLGRLT